MYVVSQVVSIGAGYNHASAVTESGKLYMWGMKVGGEVKGTLIVVFVVMVVKKL